MKASKMTTMLLKHVLSDTELLAYAKRQAAADADYREIEDQFASVKSDFKSRLEAAENERSMCARKVRDGYEMRDTSVTVHFHSPQKGKKTIFREDTGEIVDTLTMSASEMQEDLPFE